MKKFLSWLKGLFNKEKTPMTDEVLNAAPATPEVAEGTNAGTETTSQNYAVEDVATEKTVIEKLREDVDFIEAKEKEIIERFGEASKEVTAELVLKLKAFL